MSTNYQVLAGSTYQDYAGYRSGAPLPASHSAVASFTLNVALVLDRAQDPNALLTQDWGSRQQSLRDLQQSGQLWTTYGADAGAYAALKQDVTALGLRTVDEVAAQNGYVSSAASRTLWVQVNETNFSTLFGPSAELRHGRTGGDKDTWFWQGSLSLPTGWASDLHVRGLFFDTDAFDSLSREAGTAPAAALALGPQGVGNHSTRANAPLPDAIAGTHYAFPLAAGSNLATGPVALLEPDIGTVTVGADTFQHGLDTYRARMGLGPGSYTTIAPGGQTYVQNYDGERSLDVGVVSGAAPDSALLIYAGSGPAAGGRSNAFTAYQAAIWDDLRDPGVISSSFTFPGHMSPDSPFYFATNELFTDAALRNVAVFEAAGDGGSGELLGNGLTNVRGNQSSPYVVVVGGTSLSTIGAAAADPTLAEIHSRALAHDPSTLWRLMAGGLKAMPGTDPEATFVEAVWNQYKLEVVNGTDTLDPGYLKNLAGAGGVDPTHPLPAFQAGFGETPATADPLQQAGRALPDLALLAGGNMFYKVPGTDLQGTTDDGGTSAAAPLMASLAAQIDAIFADQGLPRLGYHTDLYYAASLLVPGAFNDIAYGNNTSSFEWGGSTQTDGKAITPTGYGYEAKSGFDLASGLGSPNGVLLARAMTALAHGQTAPAGSAAVIEADGQGGWTAGADQSLLVQAHARSGTTTIDLTAGTDQVNLGAVGAPHFAWDGRLATQSLQPDFSADLVRLFDGASQGMILQQSVSAGEAISVGIGGSVATAPQGTTTASFGFAVFGGAAGEVRLARAVAEARTVGGADDQDAVVRIRQNGAAIDELLFYRVDDLAGRIAGLDPGDPGYAAASLGRAYAVAEGGPWVTGPGFGNFRQVTLTGVDSGDLIAMRLRTAEGDFWAFAQANERDGTGNPVPHLWHYALDTWGWEDLLGGGDRDFNDMVVQIDFTSTAGSGVLV